MPKAMSRDRCSVNFLQECAMPNSHLTLSRTQNNAWHRSCVSAWRRFVTVAPYDSNNTLPDGRISSLWRGGVNDWLLDTNRGADRNQLNCVNLNCCPVTMISAWPLRVRDLASFASKISTGCICRNLIRSTRCSRYRLGQVKLQSGRGKWIEYLKVIMQRCMQPILEFQWSEETVALRPHQCSYKQTLAAHWNPSAALYHSSKKWNEDENRRWSFVVAQTFSHSKTSKSATPLRYKNVLTDLAESNSVAKLFSNVPFGTLRSKFGMYRIHFNVSHF